jgi:hypothetical protein
MIMSENSLSTFKYLVNEGPKIASQIARIADKCTRQRCEVLNEVNQFVQQWHDEIVQKTSLLLPNKISDDNIEIFREYVYGTMTHQAKRADLRARLNDILREKNLEKELRIIFKSLLQGLDDYEYKAVPMKKEWVMMLLRLENKVQPSAETIHNFVKDLKENVSDRMVTDAANGMNILKCTESPGERVIKRMLDKLKRIFRRG